MSVRKSNAVGSQRIDVWRFNQATFPPVAANITDAQIVRQNEHNVRTFGLNTRREGKQSHKGPQMYSHASKVPFEFFFPLTTG